ncbi:MAG: nickel-binding protein [Acidimicrobiia bacterium]
MPLFMDQHDTEGASPEDLARAHVADLQVQADHGVKFLTYWLDYQGGSANCLVDAPDPAAVNRAHAAAHGQLAGRIVPVDESEVLAFLGRVGDPPGVIVEPATRTIVFTDMVDSTAQLDEFGDVAGMETLREHNRIVRRILGNHRGREVKNTGDGFLLSFDSTSDAVRFAIELQGALSEYSHQHPERQIHVRIGMNAGEPVSEEGDLFGLAVNVAARLCGHARAGEILASAAVAGLTMGKGFDFTDAGVVSLKGLKNPLPTFRLQLSLPAPSPHEG